MSTRRSLPLPAITVLHLCEEEAYRTMEQNDDPTSNDVAADIVRVLTVAYSTEGVHSVDTAQRMVMERVGPYSAYFDRVKAIDSGLSGLVMDRTKWEALGRPLAVDVVVTAVES